MTRTRALPIAKTFVFAVAVWGFALLDCKAVTFDWGAAYATWNAGAPAPGATTSQSYNIDGVPGNDVTISITNNNSTGSGATWLNGSPGVGNIPISIAGESALQLVMQQNNVGGITLKIAFATNVRDVKMRLWDVDKSNPDAYIDQISGISANAGTIGPATVTTSLDNAATGSGTGIIVTGTATASGTAIPQTSPDGNLDIAYGPSTVVSEVSFTWKNTYTPNPGLQWIGLHDFSYTPVPEMDTAFAAMLICFGVIGRDLFKRKRSKNQLLPFVNGADGRCRLG